MSLRQRQLCVTLLSVVLLFMPLANAKPKADTGHLPLAVFLDAIGDNDTKARAAIDRIGKDWHESSAALVIEMLDFVRNPYVVDEVIAMLEKHSGIPLGKNTDPWYQWLWSTERPVHPDYADYKARMYEQIDPRFKEYFQGHPKTLIRLDEIRWGGVARDGIPPLKNPRMISAAAADWLHDDDIIFGVAIDGDVRAYPKRILAWHEMFKDKIAGKEMAGVYCTLCGALVLYDVTINGVQHELGTSGFLYRSNKLMYDHATKSMWSTLTGTPVVGPLVGKGIELKSLFVVTTTWKEWRKRHPDTLVLSRETGHQRDYDEGVAYRDYFATDKLMFTVPGKDDRLPNKAEVLALRTPQAGNESLAVSADFLVAHPLYHDQLAKQNFVVLTDNSGANRVYESQQHRFTSWDQDATVKDDSGGVWRMDESALTSKNGETLKRLSAHRAFWFGWHAAYPATRLVK